MPQGFEDALNGRIDTANTDPEYWEHVLVGVSLVASIHSRNTEDYRPIEQHPDEQLLARLREKAAMLAVARNGRHKITPAPERWQTPGRMMET